MHPLEYNKLRRGEIIKVPDEVAKACKNVMIVDNLKEVKDTVTISKAGKSKSKGSDV